MAHVQVEVPVCRTSSAKGPEGKGPLKKAQQAIVPPPPQQLVQPEGIDQGAHYRKLFRKTTMCSFFAQGCCRKGADCNYAHGEEELQVRPDRTKTALCRNWLQKKCRHDAADCKFAHGFVELNDLPTEAAPKQLPMGGGPSAQLFDSTCSTRSGASSDGGLSARLFDSASSTSSWDSSASGEAEPVRSQVATPQVAPARRLPAARVLAQVKAALVPKAAAAPAQAPAAPAQAPPAFQPVMVQMVQMVQMQAVQMVPMVPAPVPAPAQEEPESLARVSDPQQAPLCEASALAEKAREVSKELLAALLEAAKPDHYED